MPRKYRSPSPPVKHKRNNEYDARDKKYRSPSPVRRTRRHSPSPVRRNSSKNNRKYYSDSDSDTSSESDYSSEDSESTDDETDYTSSEPSESNSSDENEEEREKPGRSVRRTYKSLERDTRDTRDTRERRENESRRESDIFFRNRHEEKISNDIEREHRKENKKSKKNTQNEEDEELDTVMETGKKYSGPPRYLVLSIDGQVLEQKKIYTSNTGPKNAAQKAFNRLCTEMNKKMEITVKKLDDAKGKIMSYSFRKEELNPPIEREIGGRKVTYRHKTVSC
jgi:hypothetical protein